MSELYTIITDNENERAIFENAIKKALANELNSKKIEDCKDKKETLSEDTFVAQPEEFATYVHKLLGNDIDDTFYYSSTTISNLNVLSGDLACNVIIVGLGGTGARLLNLIAQQVAYDNRSRNKINIILCDDDIIEPKNMSRQLFYEFELGQSKVKALKDRYEMLYGLNILAFESTFQKMVSLHDIFTGPNGINIIFDCTDNIEARVAIEEYISSSIAGISNTQVGIKAFVVACGNQQDFGQVYISAYNNFIGGKKLISPEIVCSGSGDRFVSSEFSLRALYNSIPSRSLTTQDMSSKIANNPIRHLFMQSLNTLYVIYNISHMITKYQIKSDIDIQYLPGMLYYFKDMKDVEMASCADMAIADEQSMAINSTMSQIAFNYFFKILHSNKLSNNIVWGNLNNEYSSSSISFVGALLNFYSKTIYGRNLSKDDLDKASKFIVSYVNNFHNTSAIFNGKYLNDNHATLPWYCEYLISETDKIDDKWIVLPILQIEFIKIINYCYRRKQSYLYATNVLSLARYIMDICPTSKMENYINIF